VTNPTEEDEMRIRTALALGLLLSLAGCAARTGGDGIATADGNSTATAKATATATATVSDADAAIKFAQCMREHGMSWFPDPKPGEGGFQIQVPASQDKAKVDAAMAACKKYMPNGGEPMKMDPAQLEQARQMSQCMRDHGITNFPDPNPNGQMMLDGNKIGSGPGDPTFDAADKACSQFRPKAPSGAPAGGTGPKTVKG
jgi:hypothetical protein